jgi:glycosyltransferase involved in cell wall biosynthesis
LQGVHKVTKNEYFAASNARNTAFTHCDTDYIVCIDDLTVIKEGWLDVVKWGQQHKYILLGSYSKVKNLTCQKDGSYTFEHFPPGVDSRYNHPLLRNHFAQKVTGSWLFGCSFGLPLELALAVDGFDETCDGQGAEDYDFGIRLERICKEIYYSKQMFTYEDEDLHFSEGNAKFIRESKVLTDKTLMPQHKGVASDHAMLRHVLSSGSQPFQKNHLSEKRAKIRQHDYKVEDDEDVKAFIEKKDWRDGMPLTEM